MELRIRTVVGGNEPASSINGDYQLLEKLELVG
jgi:hypothetical protein